MISEQLSKLVIYVNSIIKESMKENSALHRQINHTNIKLKLKKELKLNLFTFI